MARRNRETKGVVDLREEDTSLVSSFHSGGWKENISSGRRSEIPAFPVLLGLLMGFPAHRGNRSEVGEGGLGG